MAIVACKECGGQVSDKAAACPHCGAAVAVKASPVVRYGGGFVVVVMVLAVFGAIVGNSGQKGADQNVARAPDADRSGSPVVETPTATPAPQHNYVHKEDGEYGYQPAISEEESRNGVAQKPLVLVRYFGNANDTIKLELRGGDSEAKTVVACKGQCDVAKVTTYIGNIKGETQTIRISPQSLIGAILDDALAGELEVYGKNRKAQNADG